MNNPQTILIIDNDEGVIGAVTTRLESLGYSCVSGISGAQGLAAFREFDIDLVISDLNMAGGDGIWLAKSIRELSDVPIIFVTGFHDDFGRELRAISDVSILRKPFDSQGLIDLVEASLVINPRTK